VIDDLRAKCNGQKTAGVLFSAGKIVRTALGDNNRGYSKPAGAPEARGKRLSFQLVWVAFWNGFFI